MRVLRFAVGGRYAEGQLRGCRERDMGVPTRGAESFRFDTPDGEFWRRSHGWGMSVELGLEAGRRSGVGLPKREGNFLRFFTPEDCVCCGDQKRAAMKGKRRGKLSHTQSKQRNPRKKFRSEEERKSSID